MGVKELKDSFNLVAAPEATASKAFLGYKSQGGTQYQILTFQGAWADGEKFEILSNLIRPSGDPIMMARETAAALLARRQKTE